MPINLDGNDLIAVLQEQRNNALDNAASNAATIKALLRQIETLEKQIADTTKSDDATKPDDA